MKKIVVLFAALFLFGCLLSGCQKSKVNQLNSDIETSNETQMKAESSNLNNSKANSSSDTEGKVSESEISLDEKRIIPEQSFDVVLNDWGNVTFVSYSPEAGSDFQDVSFYLMNGNQVVYSFPYYSLNNQTDHYAGLFDSVASVGFRDVNNDTLKDVIVIINYITGAGPQGMMPRPKAQIFLADKTEFHIAKDLIDDITENMDEADLNINNIYEYLKDK